jgi:hypothetical protein
MTVAVDEKSGASGRPTSVVSRRSLGWFGIVAAVCLVAFAYSVIVRIDHFGDPGFYSGVEQWATMWYEKSPFALNFALLDYFASPEAPTLESRLPYVSYGQGMILVPWLVAEILGIPPDADLIAASNLFHQLVFALALSGMTRQQFEAFVDEESLTDEHREWC